MQERLIEIIVYLLGEFKQPQEDDNYKDLSKQLVNLGYTESEINLAFSWIFNHLQEQQAAMEGEFEYGPSSSRILHDVERMIISAEAYGYLLQMTHLGLLSDFELELVIERALSIGTSNISIDDVKSIAASIIFGTESGSNSYKGFYFSQGNNTIH